MQIHCNCFKPFRVALVLVVGVLFAFLPIYALLTWDLFVHDQYRVQGHALNNKLSRLEPSCRKAYLPLWGHKEIIAQDPSYWRRYSLVDDLIWVTRGSTHLNLKADRISPDCLANFKTIFKVEAETTNTLTLSFTK